MFDLVKLQSVNNNYLSKISTDELYDQSLVRAERYKPELATLMKSDVPYDKAALNIERLTPKDPKRFTTYTDIETQLRFFFDDEREKLRDKELGTRNEESSSNPKSLPPEVLKKFIDEYVQVVNLDMSVEEWFAQLKEI